MLEFAKQYVGRVKNEETLKQQAEKKRMIREAEAGKLLEELERLVNETEASAMKILEEANQFNNGIGPGLDSLEGFKKAHDLEVACKNTVKQCSNCADFLLKNKSQIEEAEGLKPHSINKLMNLQPRIQQAAMRTAEVQARSTLYKSRIGQRLAASRRERKHETLFEKYDKDCDNRLSRQEVQDFAKAEHNYTVPQDAMEQISRQLMANGGVPKENMKLLMNQVGIARARERMKVQADKEKERKRLEEEREQKRLLRVEERRKEWVTVLPELKKDIEEVGPKVIEAENEAKELTNDAATLTGKQLKVKVEDVGLVVVPARKALAEVSERVDNLRKELDELPELKSTYTEQLTELSSRKDLFVLRMKTVEGIVDNGRQLALHKAFAEHEHMRMEIAAKLRMIIEGKGGKADDLYDAVCPRFNGKLTKDDIRDFLVKHKCEVDPVKLETVFGGPAPHEALRPSGPVLTTGQATSSGSSPAGAFAKAAGPAVVKPPALDATGNRIITKEEFTRAVRLMYKVVKEIVCSDNLHIDQSKQVRKMQLGEVLEVKQGPTIDPSVGVYRVQGQALKDGISGWVTVAGNQGVTFLMPGGNSYQCLKPCPVTEELATESKVITQMDVGEVMVVLDWQRTSVPPLGITRIKGKLQNKSGAIGWVTIADVNGVYLEAT